MKRSSRRFGLGGLASLGLALTLISGCQTWVGGMTLPSGRYLQHPPQFFPKDPDFPLERELATMEAQSELLGLEQGAPLGGGPAPAFGVPAPPPVGVPGGAIPQ